MNKIKKLDKHLMNMIAAGEVVENPAGIVKELIDNAIDANASVIMINVESGGIDLIQVIDNGFGMSKEDVILAFERHATSKIKNESDLWSIKTLGFRGEALPSIASVAKVELISNDGKATTKIKIDYGELVSVDVVGANNGTSISVSGLFHKTPARLKNFNSVNYEMAILTGNIEKFALAYPHISFILKNNDRDVFKTSGSSNLQEVLFQIYGKDIAENSITFLKKDFDFEISGILALPAYTRSNRHHIMLFINDRMIKSYKLVNQVIKGYDKYLFSNRYPIAVIKIKMDYKLVDVNVHPTKWEVKISKEKELSELIVSSIDKALSNNMQAPKVRKFNEQIVPIQSELSFMPVSDIKHLARENTIEIDIESYDVPITNYEVAKKQEHNKNLKSKDKLFPMLRLIGQMHGNYILAQDDTSLYIIDQHAAEERVNFEKISYKLNNNIIETTPLLLPELIEIKPSVMPLIESMLNKMKEIGLMIDIFSNDSIVVREIPLWLMDGDIIGFVNEVIDYLKDSKDIALEDLRKDVIATMACHASIRFNHVLSKEEMLQVINNLSETKQPYHCPHGRPTLIEITQSQLVKEFLR